MDVSEIKGELLNEFGNHAAFRREKAEKAKEADRTHDQKNTNRALSIERVIVYIESLPDDAPALQKLLACARLYDEDVGGFVFQKAKDGQSCIADGPTRHFPRERPGSGSRAGLTAFAQRNRRRCRMPGKPLGCHVLAFWPLPAHPLQLVSGRKGVATIKRKQAVRGMSATPGG